MLATRLFNIRARGLLGQSSLGEAPARLSGLLIGAELAAMRPYWLGQSVALVGDPRLNALYASALKAQGVPCQSADGDEITLRGLIAAKSAMELI